MCPPLFSERYGVDPTLSSAQKEDIPLWLRHEMVLHLRDVILERTRLKEDELRAQMQFYRYIRPIIWHYCERKPSDYSTNIINYMWDGEVFPLVQEVDWWEFLNFCEVGVDVLKECGDPGSDGIFITGANALFARAFSHWTFDDQYRIAPVRPEEITQVIVQAKGMLGPPGFEGPNEQFSNANQLLNQRPDPDTANAIKEAVGALEGVARIVANQPKATLNTLLKGHISERLHPTQREILEKLYAYRGDADGVSHGKTGSGNIPIADAEWVFGMCAVSINYLLTTQQSA